MNTIQEIARTPEGSVALFMFMFGGCLVGGIMLAAATSQDFRHFLSKILLGGIKCQSCGKRPKEWVHWHQREGETDYEGYEWCPFCDTKRYEGFQDRCF